MERDVSGKDRNISTDDGTTTVGVFLFVDGEPVGVLFGGDDDSGVFVLDQRGGLIYNEK